jgi:phosphohistidine phosphatase
MKNLLICRHGKSSWDEITLPDHDRPLAPRGLANAKEMSERLLKNQIFPELIISSTAKRARDTALIFAEKLGFEEEKIIFNPDLYHSSPSTILKIVKENPPQVHTLFVFGHNPELLELTERFGGNLDNLPTTGLYGVHFRTDDWREIGFNKARLWFYDYPKNKS